MKFNTIMMLFICVVTLFSLINAQAGVTTSINVGALNNLISNILPPLFEQVKHTQIPNQDDGHYHLRDINITDIGIDAFNINTNSVNLLQLVIQRFHAQVEMNFKYSGFISYHADVTARLDDCNISFDSQFANNNGSPVVNIGQIDVDCGEAAIKIHGGIMAKLINGIKSLFRSKIKRAIVDNVRNSITNGLIGFARRMSNTLPTCTAISNWGLMNLSLIDTVGYEGNSITVHFNGEVNRGDTLEPTSQQRYPNHFAVNNSLFSVAIGTFVFNSAFESFTRLGRWNHGYGVNKPGPFGQFVHSITYKDIFPGFYRKYPDQNLSYNIAMEGIPQITAQGGVASFTATPLLHIDAEGGHVCTLRLTITSSVTVAIIKQDGWRIIPQIQGLNVHFDLINSSMGQFNLEKFNTILGISFDIISSVINNEMIQGVSIPSVHGMQLSDPSIIITDNTFIAYTGIHFDL